jgi:hypothetical protein
VQVFTREALNIDPTIMRLKNDFKAFRDRRKKSTKEQSAERYRPDADVYAVLPEKCIVDVRTVLYFRTCETSYKILHEPSFWEDYHAFWEQSCTDKERITFAVMLLLIIAITKCLNPKDDVFVGDTTADRQAAQDLICVCENWINLQPRKRLTLPLFQLQCLLLLAKRVNCVGLKQDWIAAGELLRLALASGMHRDPNLQGCDSISIFDQQMKKRLWVTVMELELQSSVDCGLQSGLTALYSDTPAPAHLADEVFSTDTRQLPPEQPDAQFTSTSFLIASLKSLPLRIHLTHLLNTPTSNIRYTDVMQFDVQIHAAISALPNWESESAQVPSALLRLQLRQYLLILHKPFAKLASKNSRFMHSLTTCVDACNSIITIHDELLSKGILFLSNLRNDIIRAGLTLSQVVFQNCTLSTVKLVAPAGTSDTELGDPLAMRKRGAPLDGVLYLATLPQDSFLIKTLCASSLDILQRTRQMFEQKIFRLGTGYMEYWVVSAAVGMLPPPPSPTTSITYINNGSDDIVSRCRKTLDCFTALTFRVLALQQNPKDSLASSLRTTMSRASQSEGTTPSTSNNTFDARTVSGMTPTAFGNSTFTQTNGIANIGSGNMEKDMDSPFGMLQDMQIGSNNWSFPDFWAFDLSGEF